MSSSVRGGLLLLLAVLDIVGEVEESSKRGYCEDLEKGEKTGSDS